MRKKKHKKMLKATRWQRPGRQREEARTAQCGTERQAPSGRYQYG
jgi:hypothetical protein